MMVKVFLVLALTACSMSKYKDKEIEEILNTRYKQEFKVTSNYFETGLNIHQFEAEVVDQPEIKIAGSYVKKGDEIKDNYPQALHCFQARAEVLDFLKKYYDDVAVKVDVSSPYHKGMQETPDSLQTLMASETSARWMLKIYLFHTLTKDNKKALDGILALIDKLDKWPNKKYYFEIGYWEDDYFSGKNIEEIPFGFNVYNDVYFDTVEQKNKHLKQIMFFKFSSGAHVTIDAEKLYDIMVPFAEANKTKTTEF